MFRHAALPAYQIKRRLERYGHMDFRLRMTIQMVLIMVCAVVFGEKEEKGQTYCNLFHVERLPRRHQFILS